MGTPDSPEAALSGCPFATLEAPLSDTNASKSRRLARVGPMRTDPDPGQMTAKGCECTSSCAATIEDGFNCAWCNTKGDCGHHSIISGYYDYCVFPGTPSFDKMSFQDKNAYFQANIDKDHTRAEKYASKAAILTESSQVSFWDYKDELPAGRVKAIHSIGAVCQFTLDVTAASPYTGLFAPGPQLGFVRMGGAISWDKSSAGYPPGPSDPLSPAPRRLRLDLLPVKADPRDSM